MKMIRATFTLVFAASALVFAQQSQPTKGSVLPEGVSFPTSDGGLVYAHLYGKSQRGVVLAHGGRFNKESWEPQAQTLTKAGFCVLAIDFRGYGQSQGPGAEQPLAAPLYYDVLAAVQYLRKVGVRSVAVIGASMGGGAAGEASARAAPGEIDRLVLLGSDGGKQPERMQGKKLFILTRDDFSGENTPRLPRIRAHYDRAPKPKRLVLLEGSAHAQAIFQTAQSDRLMREILRFLS